MILGANALATVALAGELVRTSTVHGSVSGSDAGSPAISVSDSGQGVAISDGGADVTVNDVVLPHS